MQCAPCAASTRGPLASCRHCAASDMLQQSLLPAWRCRDGSKALPPWAALRLVLWLASTLEGVQRALKPAPLRALDEMIAYTRSQVKVFSPGLPKPILHRRSAHLLMVARRCITFLRSWALRTN